MSSVDWFSGFIAMLGIDEKKAFTAKRDILKGTGYPDKIFTLDLEGRNFWQLAEGKTERIYGRVFSEFGPCAMVRDEKW
jgi:hypothetical protein